MFKARVKRLEVNVAHLLENITDRRKMLSCLDEATSLCKTLEQQREELGLEILKLRNARSVAQSYNQSFEIIKGKRNLS